MRPVLALLLLVTLIATACGGSAEPSGSSDGATTAAAASGSTGDAVDPTCSDEDITLITQQVIGTLNAMQTDITKQWFVMQKVQDVGIERVTAEVEQMRSQVTALKTCKVLTDDQAKLVPAALGALAVGEEFATTTLELVDNASLKADIDALKRAKGKMNGLTAKVNEAFATFSTQWESWKLKHR